MQAIGSISLIAVDWFKFIGLLDGLESYSPGMLVHSTLGLQASIFVLYCALKNPAYFCYQKQMFEASSRSLSPFLLTGCGNGIPKNKEL